MPFDVVVIEYQIRVNRGEDDKKPRRQMMRWPENAIDQILRETTAPAVGDRNVSLVWKGRGTAGKCARRVGEGIHGETA